MTDPSWDSYVGPDASTSSTEAEPAVPQAAVDAAQSNITSGDTAADWGDWHAASGDQWARSAADYTHYAEVNAAEGNTEIAASAYATAANHADIAAGNYGTAGDYDASAASSYQAAEQDLSGYDTGTDATA